MDLGHSPVCLYIIVFVEVLPMQILKACNDFLKSCSALAESGGAGAQTM